MKKFSLGSLVALSFIGMFFGFADHAYAAVDCDYNTCISGDITTNTTWATTTAAYVIQGTITITTGNTLTINPGVVVKFSPHTSLDVTGVLSASTTGASPIIFTSLKDDGADSHDSGGDGATSGAAQDWRYIKINSGGLMEIKNAIVRYAGREIGGLPGINIWNNAGTLKVSSSTVSNSGIIGIQNDGTSVTTIATSTISNTQYGVWVNGGTVSIASTTLDTNSQYGIYATGNTGTVVSVANNLFTNNSVGAAYILPTNGLALVNHGGNRAPSGGKRGFIFFGDITTNQTWVGDGMPYIAAEMTIPATKTLTVNRGTVIKFENSSAYIGINGTLAAKGTATEKVYFTSINDDVADGRDTENDGATTGSAGDWKEVKINNRGTLSAEYVVFAYGGNTSGADGNIYNSGGALVLNNSEVASSTTYGIYQDAGSATSTASEIHTQSTGILVTTGTATFGSSFFHGNSSYGIANTSGTQIVAKYNYWNSSDGPAGEGPGSGDAASVLVDYSDWLDAEHFLFVDDGFVINSVDSGEEIHWDFAGTSTTQYLDAWYAAVETWNNEMEVNIATDTIFTILDLTVEDTYTSTSSIAGFYDSNASPDRIVLNQYHFQNYSSSQKQMAVTHELGHALGLWHSYINNIMIDFTTSQTSLGSQDLLDYDYCWASNNCD